MRAKKSFGQHFLTNYHVCERIVEEIALHTDKTPNILEVGPGKGALTKYLLQMEGINLKCVELDWDMVFELNKTFPELEENLIHSDFLKLDFAELFDGEEFILVGNFPYNISSQIFMKTVINRSLVPVMIGMFQKEMADRILGSEGTKSYSSLSVYCKLFFEGKKFIKVSKGSFNPPPRVESAVISISRKEDPPQIENWQKFENMVRAAFKQRRKKLKNSLQVVGVEEATLQEYSGLRPEQINHEDFLEIFNRQKKNR